MRIIKKIIQYENLDAIGVKAWKIHTDHYHLGIDKWTNTLSFWNFRKHKENQSQDQYTRKISS